MSNPYEAPETVSGVTDAGLASHGQRLLGWLIDAGLQYGGATIMVVIGAMTSAAVYGPETFENEDPDPIIMGFTFLAILVYLGLRITNWVLITKRGQTLGKMAMNTRIVRTNGDPCGFVYGVILRDWVLGFIVGIANYCCMGWFVLFVDSLMIFGTDRRCGHDQLSDTKVIDIG